MIIGSKFSNKPVVLASACLLGLATRYDGASKPFGCLLKFKEYLTLVPICPEIYSGLGTPREKRRFTLGDGHAVLAGHARVVAFDGTDSTRLFLNGAQMSLDTLMMVKPNLIVLKNGSPSCGVTLVDIDGQSREGSGVTAALFKQNGFEPMSEETCSEAIIRDLY